MTPTKFEGTEWSIETRSDGSTRVKLRQREGSRFVDTCIVIPSGPVFDLPSAVEGLREAREEMTAYIRATEGVG